MILWHVYADNKIVHCEEEEVVFSNGIYYPLDFYGNKKSSYFYALNEYLGRFDGVYSYDKNIALEEFANGLINELVIAEEDVQTIKNLIREVNRYED